MNWNWARQPSSRADALTRVIAEQFGALSRCGQGREADRGMIDRSVPLFSGVSTGKTNEAPDHVRRNR
jgi:hypothetical protein